MPHGSPPARGPRVQAPFLARRRGPRTKAPTDHGGWWPWGSGAENPSSPGDPPPALFLYTAWQHSKGNILYIASAVSLASRFRSRDLSGVSFPFMAAEQSAVPPPSAPQPKPSLYPPPPSRPSPGDPGHSHDSELTPAAETHSWPFVNGLCSRTMVKYLKHAPASQSGP